MVKADNELGQDFGGRPGVDSGGHDAAFGDRARALLDESVANLDGHIRSRLTQARHLASAQIDAAGAAPRYGLAHGFARWLLPLTGTFAASVVAVVVWTASPHGGTRPATPDVALEDVDVVSADENLDLAQNAEFYSWVDKQLKQGPGDGGG